MFRLPGTGEVETKSFGDGRREGLLAVHREVLHLPDQGDREIHVELLHLFVHCKHASKLGGDPLTSAPDISPRDRW